ncbi:hypothetical protein [Mesorhizobium ventifaucium]|uniref:Uncharacterized protein n=1 Tax=Mesorhizobium ventifaucium TaxID=666020 RepID=A0ABN8K0Y7_9HYPH|nr:hypothetical protein [Mesorhizobium ventifaucium]CAH2402043.1 hypothetical protein MES4922_30417 [Mesorhizobium ventifaucium]
MIAHGLLLQGAVTIGHQFPLGGMVMLSLVVLAKLTVLVTMFVVLRPHMPAVAALRQKAKKGVDETKREPVLAITAAAILPFFAYYAAWGFLGIRFANIRAWRSPKPISARASTSSPFFS